MLSANCIEAASGLWGCNGSTTMLLQQGVGMQQGCGLLQVEPETAGAQSEIEKMDGWQAGRQAGWLAGWHEQAEVYGGGAGKGRGGDERGEDKDERACERRPGMGHHPWTRALQGY